MEAPVERKCKKMPKDLLPALWRFAAAASVGLLLTVVWVEAETASHHAVDLSSIAISPPNIRFVKLPTIEVIGRKVTKPNAT
jgi:hypothetical protein